MDAKQPLILVVDDFIDIRQLFRLELNCAQFEVIEADNGLAAIQMAIDHQPDLILMDVQMPVLDGWEAFKRLRNEARTKDIPVIFTTALDQPRDLIKNLTGQHCDFITRPIEYKSLIERINQFIKLHPRQIREAGDA